MKTFGQALYHPWYWRILPFYDLYYIPNTGGKWKDLGIQLGWLCFSLHGEIGQTRPWDRRR